MYKNLILGILVIAVLGLGYYLISPVFIVEEKDEPFPGQKVTEGTPKIQLKPVVNDDLEKMAPERKKEFEQAVEKIRDKRIEVSEPMPKPKEKKQEIRIVAKGEFKPRAHDVAGKALLIFHEGKKVLRFENFNTINGPNLHIYLSADLGDADFIDLGKIRATKGNVNYEVDPKIDIRKYNKVLVWCVPFRVLFSYAELETSN